MDPALVFKSWFLVLLVLVPGEALRPQTARDQHLCGEVPVGPCGGFRKLGCDVGTPTSLMP